MTLVVAANFLQSSPFAVDLGLNVKVPNALRILIEGRICVVFAQKMNGKCELHRLDNLRRVPLQIEGLRKSLCWIGTPKICSRIRAGMSGKTVRETEAEAVAFVVSQTIGLDAGRASADYIHLYHGNAALLAESLEVIQKTSALILSNIETAPSAAERDNTNTAVAEVA